MGMGDIVALIIIGLSVFGPFLAKLQQKAKSGASGESTPPSEPDTGLQVAKGRRPAQRAQTSIGQGSTTGATTVRATPTRAKTGQAIAGRATARRSAPQTSSGETSVARAIRRKPRASAAKATVSRPKKTDGTSRTKATRRKGPQTPEAKIAALHAARKERGSDIMAPDWRSMQRQRAWTRLQEAVVYREMLGPPKALQNDY